ncbi:PAS domain S-box protein [Deinococcus sp. UYEF24]
MHPDDQPLLRAVLKELVAGRSAELPRFRVMQSGGTWQWLCGWATSFLQDPEVRASLVRLNIDAGLVEAHKNVLEKILSSLQGVSRTADVVEVILSTAIDVLSADAGSVSTLDAEGQQLGVFRHTGYAEDPGSGERGVDVNRSGLLPDAPVSQGHADRQPLFLQSQELSLHPARFLRPSAPDDAPFQSGAFLPLLSGDLLLGTLTLSFREDQTFGADKRSFYRTVAGLYASALDRCRLSEALEREQDWSRALHLNSSDIATVLDSHGVILYESGSVQRVLGYGAADLIGQEIFSLTHPDDHTQLQDVLSRLSPEGDPLSATSRCRHKDGHWIWLEGVATDLRGNPHVNGVLVNSRDVTAREEARIAAQESLKRLTTSEQNFRRLADHTSDLVRQYTPDGRVEYVSPSAFNLLGYESAELMAQEPLHWVHEEDLPLVQDSFRRRFDPEALSEKLEYRLRRKDGSYLWVETSFKSVRDAVIGKVTAFIGTSRDIDLRKATERKLNVQLDRYRQLLNFTASLEQTREPSELTAEALRKCLELTEYEYGYVLSRTGDTLTVDARAGDTTPATDRYISRISRLRQGAFARPIQRALQRREAYFGSEGQPILDPPESMPRAHWPSLCVLPITQQGELTKVLVFGTDSSLQTSEETSQLLENVAARLSHALERSYHLEQLHTSREETLRALGLALEYRDYETKGHTDRVVSLTEHLGQALGFEGADLAALRWGAFLHDTGKVAIPDAILLKPGKLTPEEWETIKRHPTIGYEMLHHIPSLPPSSLEVVLYHQERWNGSGYPIGLSGTQIPLAARVFAVVDVYDALTSERPYKPAWTHHEAALQLQAEAGNLLDARVVKAFLACLIAKGYS